MAFDLLIKGARIVDPAQGVDGLLDIAFADGKVARLAPDVPAGNAARVVRGDDTSVLPGLIDLHTHVYWGGTSIGVDAKEIDATGAAPICVYSYGHMRSLGWISATLIQARGRECGMTRQQPL